MTLFILILLSFIIGLLFRPKAKNITNYYITNVENYEQVEDSIYSDGRKNTNEEQKIIDKMMDEFIAKNPNSEFAKNNPQYVENYLSRIDLSELDESLGKK